MEFARKKRLIGIVSIVAALALVGIFCAIFPRTSYYKIHQRANWLKQVLRNVAPPAGTEAEIDVIYSEKMPMALGTYVLNASCEEVLAHYQKEFPKHGFTYAGSEINALNPKDRSWIIFLTPEYRALFHCSNVKSEVTRESYSIQLYYQSYPEPPPARTSASANALTQDTYPAPQARKSLARPEASNAKRGGWVRSCAVQPKRNLGFSPSYTLQGLKAEPLLSFTARLKSCPDTCLASRCKKLLSRDIHHPIFLRASVSLWWGLSA